MVPNGKKGKRRYGCWAGDPTGKVEDISRCIEGVYPSWTRAPISGQCTRKRGYGPDGEFCKQHAKKVESK